VNWKCAFLVGIDKRLPRSGRVGGPGRVSIRKEDGVFIRYHVVNLTLVDSNHETMWYSGIPTGEHCITANAYRRLSYQKHPTSLSEA
jgi:hypothetical protein